MSGLDEQPSFPICERCEKGHTNAGFWIAGRTSMHLVEDTITDEVSDITDYLYLDKRDNGVRCARTDKHFPTLVSIPIEPHLDMYKDDSNEKVLEILLSNVNVVKCSNDHVYAPGGMKYRHVLTSIKRNVGEQGVRWE